MSVKSKLTAIITMTILVVCIIIVGVLAVGTQKISMKGNIDFNIADKSLYIRDVRIQQDTNEAPYTVPGFLKGYVNGDFKMDLSTQSIMQNSTGSFVLYFDIVNLSQNSQTSNLIAEAAWTTGVVSGVNFEIREGSQYIDEATASAETFNESTPLSGTIELEVNLTTGTSFDLSNITVTIREPQAITDFTFTTSSTDMTAAVTGYSGKATTVTVPSSVSLSGSTVVEGEDYRVTEVGSAAFQSKTSITSIKLPNSIDAIGSNAFNGCTALSNINIPLGVTEIGSYAFNNCNKLTSITVPDGVTTLNARTFYGCSGLTSIDLSDNITSVGDYAFYGCSKLTSIPLPSTVTSIGSYAFRGCSGLTGTFAIPTGVSVINQQTFYGCSNLTGVTIPSTVTTINGSAFYNCSKLTNVPLPSTLRTIGSSAFYGCRVLSNITLPSGLTTLGSSAFYNCIALNNISIPSGITTINSSTFSGCTSLSQVALPSSLQEIDMRAFLDCADLTQITFPTSLKTIDDAAFSGCGFTSISIPASVTTIGVNPFEFCSSLRSIEVASGNTRYASNGCDAIINTGDLKIVTGCATTTIPTDSSVFVIGEKAFAGSELSSIIIPDPIRDIENEAFIKCKNLTSVTIYATRLSGVGEGIFVETKLIKLQTDSEVIADILGSEFGRLFDPNFLSETIVIKDTIDQSIYYKNAFAQLYELVNTASGYCLYELIR